METRKLAFLGLGVMGFPMAGHLARAGHSVTVYNRTASRAEKWLASMATAQRSSSARTPAAAAAGAGIVMMCVGNDDDVRAVALGPDGAVAAMQPGSILVDHTTASATVAREVHQAAAARGIGFLDAPVSGGQAGAENGKLTIMVGGDADTYAAAEPVLATYAKAVTLMGGPGSGQLTKMVNQICVAGLVQALSEGINFAARAGLDVEKVLDVIGKGAAQSWQMDNRGKTMAADQFNFGFAVDWMRKDLSICLGEARANGTALPVTALVDQFYARIQAQGGARWDTSSLIRLLR
ncbi:MAG: NAD(P)-dependent oxidoreductase [Betaproteobacteria bacterium]|nr:MAG: NAD(P)-dependent oxidoreductase [Betaproteobacteria bacterium]